MEYFDLNISPITLKNKVVNKAINDLIIYLINQSINPTLKISPLTMTKILKYLRLMTIILPLICLLLSNNLITKQLK